MPAKTITGSLTSLIGGKSRGNGRLPAPQTRDPIPAGLSIGELSAASADAGIASPLTEPDATTRTAHDFWTVQSSDQFFAWEIEPWQQIDMEDANGAEVKLVFDDPFAAER